MKKLLAVLVVGTACWCIAPVVADAAAPPTTPTNVSATLVPDGQAVASIDVSWTASTDADGGAITYDVLTGQEDFVRVTHVAATTARITVSRGEAARITVEAVDASGAHSAASPPITLTAPPVAVHIRAGIRRSGGLTQSCAGVAHACSIASRSGLSVRVHATSTAKLTYARVQLNVLWRKPGTSKFVKRPAVFASIAHGDVPIPLARVVVSPGTWCVRPVLAPNAGNFKLAGPFRAPTCVSYFFRPVAG